MRRLAGVAFVLFVLFLSSTSMWLVGFYASRAGAVGGAWSGDVSITELPTLTGLQNSGNLECSYMNLKSRYVFDEEYADGVLTYDDDTYDQPGRTFTDICMSHNQHGLVGSGYWVPGLDINQALPVISSPYGMVAVPGGSATLFTATNPLGGLTYSVNHNLPHIGKLAARTVGSGSAARKEKIWQITSVGDMLQYSDGSAVRITSVGFSSNGRFMVAQLYGRGLVRIDLKSREMVPFAANNYTSGTNYINVSNDGSYVAFARDGTLLIHDLSGCEQKFAENEWPAVGDLSTVGCQAQQFTTSIKSVYPLTESISGLRFSPNGARLTVRLFWRENSVATERYISLTADNYVSGANGYLAMGDSFSSGEGDTQGGTWYEPGTDEQGNVNTFEGRNLCHLSRRSYPYLMAVELGYLSTNTLSPPASGLFHSVACSGAGTHNVVGVTGEKQDDGNAIDFQATDNQYRYSNIFSLIEWQPGYERQVGFIAGRADDVAARDSFSPEVITLGIGGNDIGFGPKLSACANIGTCEFASNVDERVDVIIEMASEKAVLERTFKTVKSEAPDSRIYVLGYPQIVAYPITTCGTNVPLNEEEIRFIYEATKYYNDVIEAAAASTGVTYINVENALVDANLCSGASQSDMAVNGVTAGNDFNIIPSNFLSLGICPYTRPGCIGNESFHPNQKGHQRYKETIKSASAGLTAPNPEPTDTPVPIPDDYFGVLARAYVEILNDPSAEAEQPAKLREFISGVAGYRQINVSLDGHLPHSIVEMWAESEPVPLGTFTVDANGRLEATLNIPTDLPGGYHEIHIVGRDTTGNKTHYYEPIMLAVQHDDFDGDGVLNETDSCLTIPNSGVDIDSDNIDDACDIEAFAPSPEEPEVPSEPPAHPKEDNVVTKIIKLIFKIATAISMLFRSIFRF